MEEIRSESSTGGNHWSGGGGSDVVMDQHLQGGPVEQSVLSNSDNTISIDPDDWRLHLPTDDRRNIVIKLKGGFKKCLPRAETSRISKIGVGYEEMIYSKSTSQSDYRTRISDAMRIIWKHSHRQRPTSNSLQINDVNTSRISSDQASSLDSTAQTENAGARDRHEEFYQKIKSLKDTYLLQMNEMCMKIAAKMEELSQQPNKKLFDKLKTMKDMMEPLIHFVQLSKNDIHISGKRISDCIESQIINILIAYKIHEKQMNPLMQPMNMQTSAATMAANSPQQNNTLSGQQPVNSSLRTKQLPKQQEQLQVVQSQRMKRIMHQKQMSRFVNHTQLQHRLVKCQRQDPMSSLLADFFNLDIGVDGNSSTQSSNTVEQDTDQLIQGLQKLMHEEIDPTVACEEEGFGGQAATEEASEDMHCI